MNTKSIILPLVFVIALLSLLSAEPAISQEASYSAPLQEQNAAWEEKQLMYDYRQIKAIWSEYCCSRCACDAESFIALHEMDAFKMPPNRPMFRISDVAPNLQANWDTTSKTMDVEMSIDCKEIVVAGDYAWSMGTYSQVFKTKNGEIDSTFNGKFLTVFHRQADGTWKICRDCFNSNEPSSI